MEEVEEVGEVEEVKIRIVDGIDFFNLMIMIEEDRKVNGKRVEEKESK